MPAEHDLDTDPAATSGSAPRPAAPPSGAPPSGAAPPDPASGTLAAGQVRSMFDSIAGVYDLLNTAMTAGLHYRWRERAVDLARVGPGSRVLDVATGTGDLAFALAHRVSPGGEVIGCDFAEGMLARANEKASAVPPTDVRPRFEWADALELDYASSSFDAATVGFGARNFAELDRGLAEMARVVRPGGRVVVLEITTPRRPPLSLFYGLWFNRVVPVLGRLVQGVASAVVRLRMSGRRDAKADASSSSSGGIGDAYTYLPSSVKRFPGPAQLAAEMEAAGLVEISYVLLAGGIVAVHAGTVSGERA